MNTHLVSRTDVKGLLVTFLDSDVELRVWFDADRQTGARHRYKVCSCRRIKMSNDFDITAHSSDRLYGVTFRRTLSLIINCVSKDLSGMHEISGDDQGHPKLCFEKEM
jgi:hypothetical protein